MCTVSPEFVQLPAVVNETSSPDEELAETVKSASPNVWFGIAANVIVWPALPMLNDWLASGAGLFRSSPAWCAVTVHEPAPVMCTVAPLFVQLPALVNVTGRPDDAVAETVKSASPNVWSGMAGKVM